ncbi:MAG: VOC family protein [Thermodesulfobacteriota bacterium]|jgi:catechol 2,3-dioxygenase-like lactoylglutathione lyase family enzyme
MIDGLDHVHILCGDVAKSVRYFEEVFGGRVESRGELRGFPMIRMDVKGVFLNLMGTDPKAAALEVGKGSRGLDHFGFKVKDLEKTVEDLKKKGARISAGPGVTPAGVKFAFIDGPEGIRIELVER